MIEVLFLIVLGVFAGLMSGLLGLGGGVIVVPGLLLILKWVGMPSDTLMHVAAGTSLCVMIITTSVSAYSHHKRGNVLKPLFKTMLPFVLVSAVVGSVVAHFVSGIVLSILFGLFLIFTGVRLLIPRKKTIDAAAEKPPVLSTKKLGVIGSLMGFLSGMLGVGGGTVTIPLLMQFKVDIKKAAATSVALTLPVSIVGTIAEAIVGWHAVQMPWTTGYVYWPGVLWIGVSSVIFAVIGARLTDVVPAHVLRTIFAILMLILAGHMLWGAL